MAEAELRVKAVLETNSQQPYALYALGLIAKRSYRYKEAFQLLGKAAFLLPQEFNPLAELADLLVLQGEKEKAHSCFERLKTIFPDNADSYFFYARGLFTLGSLETAKPLLEKCLELSPHHSAALMSQSLRANKAEAEVLVKKIEEIILAEKDDLDATLRNSIELHYALARCFDLLGISDKAFKSWTTANRKQLSLSAFKTSDLEPFFSSLKQGFAGLGNYKKTDFNFDKLPKPIFIVGMPRSGSTLLEQMLASHPKINSVGEVNFVATELVASLEKETNESYPELIGRWQEGAVSDIHLQNAGRRLLSRMCELAPDSEFVIDKLPANFQSIGVILRCLPEAIIINLTRDPGAIAFSIYSNYFAENEPYFCDLKETAIYYSEYLSMMNFWRSLDYPVLDITYEELLGNPQDKIQEVLNLCGLAWDDACLNFYNNRSPVLTLSAQQVRQPLYQSAKNKWQDYQDFLNPFFRTLEDKHQN